MTGHRRAPHIFIIFVNHGGCCGAPSSTITIVVRLRYKDSATRTPLQGLFLIGSGNNPVLSEVAVLYIYTVLYTELYSTVMPSDTQPG